MSRYAKFAQFIQTYMVIPAVSCFIALIASFIIFNAFDLDIEWLFYVILGIGIVTAVWFVICFVCFVWDVSADYDKTYEEDDIDNDDFDEPDEEDDMDYYEEDNNLYLEDVEWNLRCLLEKQLIDVPDSVAEHLREAYAEAAEVMESKEQNG